MAQGDPIRLPRLSLASLRLLALVASTGSIGAAARAAGLSQPAVSAALHRLERATGIRLVTRSPRGSLLTEAGARVAEASGDVLAEADRFEATVREIRGTTRLRVAASLTIAEHLVPARLDSSRPHAGLELTVANSETVMARVLSGAADLGFVEGASVDARLSRTRIGRDRLVLVVGAGHPWSSPGTEIDAQRLIAANLVVRERGSGTREVLEEALARVGLGVPPRATSMGSTEAIKALVARGQGVAVLSELAVGDELRSGLLVPVAVRDLVLERELQAVWPGGRPLSASAAALVRSMTREDP